MIEPSNVFKEIERLLAEPTARDRPGEPLTLKTHLLHTAWLATQEGAGAPLVVACLLHDVGHMMAADRDGSGLDHAEIGSRWLARFYGPDVTEPVRLHVAAKRYLCAKDPSYTARLAPASQRSLIDQGGPLRGWHIEAYAARPFAIDAMRLRRWDDRARNSAVVVPGLEHYAPMLAALVLPDAQYAHP